MKPIVEQLGKFFLTIDNEPYDQNKEYEKLTLVEANHRFYISRADVPAGIDISNTTYWKAYPIAPSSLDVQLLDVSEEFTSEKYPAEGSSLIYVCTDSQGNLSGGKLACHDSLGRLIHASEIQADYHVGVHLGDLLLATNKNGTILIKHITDDEAVIPTDNTLYDGLMTSKDKQSIEDLKLQFKGEQNINYMLTTGFYYGVIGRPAGSEDGEYYHVYVKASDIADRNGNYSIQQTLYDIKYPVKVYQRLGFTTDKSNSDMVSWEQFNLISGNFIDKGGVDANNDLETGFYGYVSNNKPSESTSWGSLSVKRADKSDNNGYVSIEQTFYGRNGEDNGKVWNRLLFYNVNTKELQIFNWTSSKRGSDITITDISIEKPTKGDIVGKFSPGTYRFDYPSLSADGGVVEPNVIIYSETKCKIGNDEVILYKKPELIFSFDVSTDYTNKCTLDSVTGKLTYPSNTGGIKETFDILAHFTDNNHNHKYAYNLDTTTPTFVPANEMYFNISPDPNLSNWRIDLGNNKPFSIMFPDEYKGQQNIEAYFDSIDIDSVVGKVDCGESDHILKLKLTHKGSSFILGGYDEIDSLVIEIEIYRSIKYYSNAIYTVMPNGYMSVAKIEILCNYNDLN